MNRTLNKFILHTFVPTYISKGGVQRKKGNSRNRYRVAYTWLVRKTQRLPSSSLPYHHLTTLIIVSSFNNFNNKSPKSLVKLRNHVLNFLFYLTFTCWDGVDSALRSLTIIG